MPNFRIVSFRVRSALKSFACRLEDSSIGGLVSVLRGREPGCSYVVPVGLRFHTWLAVAVTIGFTASVVSGVGTPHWQAAIAGAGGALLHLAVERLLPGGFHSHCSECDTCSLDHGGRAFGDRRNAVAFAISELGWFATRNGRVYYCTDHLSNVLDHLPPVSDPASGTAPDDH